MVSIFNFTIVQKNIKQSDKIKKINRKINNSIIIKLKKKNFNENKNLKKEVIYKFFEKIFAKRKILKISSEKFKKSNYQLTNLQNP